MVAPRPGPADGDPNVTSTFGWLDTDTEQRRRMLEVVDLFREQGTLDELGIGTIRDALSGALFPGTSELHTRLRYVLFVPWLLQRAAHRETPAEMQSEFRRLEYRLIGSLMTGGEQLGVIGNTARDHLKRVPSVVYWSALTAWGIHTSEFSSDGFFRRQADYRGLARRTLASDDPEAGDRLPGTGIDPHLPTPPDDLVRATDFTLTRDEEQYLSDRIARSTKGSMLSWLIDHQPGNKPDYVWDVDNLSEAPGQLAELVDHARRFHTAIDGAGLVYHLLLARKSGREKAVDGYTDDLARWRDELDASKAMEGWSRADWWATIRRQNPRLRLVTKQFVDSWLDLAATQDDLAASRAAADLVSSRERQIKGGRARLVNQSALDSWSGRGGRYDLRFRWLVGRSHLNDLYAARGS